MTDSTFNVGPDGSATDSTARTSLLDQFKADMAADAPDVDVLVPHKYRKGYAMRFHTDLPTRQLTRFQKQCVTDRRKGELDQIKLSAIILGNLCTAIVKDGEELLDPAGNPVTFGSRFFLDAMGHDEAVDAIQTFMVRDGFLLAVAEEMLKQCGYDDEVVPDPTSAS